MNTPQLFTLQQDELRIVISDYGARLLSVQLGGEELLYGPKDCDAMLADRCYCGAICGRVANRIEGGRATLSNGVELELPLNNGGNHLHGGLRSFSDQLWRVESHSESHLELSLCSPDGDEGYPGEVQLRACYSLVGNSLSLDLKAHSDALTLLNLTHHAYWNLSQQREVLQHELRVSAQQYTPMVENIPTGEIAPVADTLFDLREPVLLATRMGEGTSLPLGYDDNYCLTASDTEPQVELRAGARRLRLWTDALGLQVYTGYYLPDPFGGVALEPQSYPDAPHHAHFPSIELAAGEPYHRRMIWEFA